MTNDFSSTIEQALINLRFVLEHAELNYVPITENPEYRGFHVLFSKDEPIEQGDAILLQGQELFVLYLKFHNNITAENFSDVLEFITRANWSLNSGNFEMDFDSRILRFKSSIDYQSTRLLPELIRNVILNAFDTISVYEEQLGLLIKGQKSAQAAIRDAEIDLL